MFKKVNNKAFTLIETLIGILIVSIIMVGAFQALIAIGIGKVRLIQKTNTQKQSLYFSEKLFEMIKYGGTLDYEEFFNRRVVNSDTSLTTIYSSGHYIKPTGFGNYSVTGIVGSTTYTTGGNYYYCTSPSMIIGDGCYASYLNTGSPQTYGQYSFQFIDYNSNADGDGGDQDGIDGIIGDDDDEYLGQGPIVFDINTDTKELYLINGVKRERIFFRYNVILDPNRPPAATCNTSDGGSTYTGSGCLGTIEYLKLQGKDWGLDHDLGIIDATQFDGVIDTWVIDEDFVTGDIIAGSNSIDYWQSLFPENINVTEFKVFPQPNIDLERAWKESDENQNVAEYVRIQLGMKPAWKDRKMLKGDPQEYNFSTTISLTDIFTQ